MGTGLLLAVLQAGTEPHGPLDWTLRNWLGLLCQVVAFVLLVSLIFWLANIGTEEEKAEAAAKPPPGEGPPAGPGTPPSSPGAAPAPSGAGGGPPATSA